MNESQVAKAFFKIGINLSKTQSNQFCEYNRLLIEWNKQVNLTAITNEEDVLTKHFIDSLLSVSIIDFNGYGSLVDVGTGAGFPGIPIKIVFPHLEVVLIDSLNKRIQFLEHVIEKIDLKNIKAIHGRAEDVARTEYREYFDLCVSRAVSQLNVLSEYCLPFIKIGGLFISYKGTNVAEELEKSQSAIALMGGHVEEVKDQIELKHDVRRTLIGIRKKYKTDEKYPRRAGKPLKKPL